MNELTDNTGRLHTTKAGEERIRKNLNLETPDVIAFCTRIITDKNCRIYGKGKNYYCEKYNVRLTVNASSFTVITAHTID